MSSPLDFDSEAPLHYRRQQSASWIGTMSAVLVGSLLAGAVLLVGLRFYVHWSIRDANDQFLKALKDQQKSR